MLLSNELHSFGLTTRTSEAEFVAPRVKNFQTISQFVLRACNEHIGMLSFREYQYKTSQSNQQTYNFVKPDVAQKNGLFFMSKRCSSEVGKGCRKLIVMGSIRCIGLKFALPFVIHCSTKLFESFSGFSTFETIC